jgi:hypothetical protein
VTTSSVMSSTVSASDLMAPVHGEQPSERIRHLITGVFHRAEVVTNGCFL